MIINRGDVVKIWKSANGGTGHDYVIIGQWSGSPPDQPLLVVIKKTLINSDGSLHKKAHFFLMPPNKIKAFIGKINLDDAVIRWKDGAVSQQTTKQIKIGE